MDLRTLITAPPDRHQPARVPEDAPLTGLLLGVGSARLRPRRRRAAEVRWRRHAATACSDSPKIFVSIAPDGTVSVVVHRSEMGQGVRTSMPRIVADELEADFKRVRVVQAPGDEAKYGNQDTDGSRSTRHWFEPMRRCGAAARQMLEQAAANQWHVPLDQVEARNHEVVDKKSGRKLGYGALAVAAAKLDVPPRASLKLKDPSKFRYIGKNDTTLTDGPVIVNGKSQYGIDTRLPGMLYAVVARPPVLGGKVQELRCRRSDEGAGCRQGVRDRRHAAAFGVHAGRRRGRRRQGHLGGDPGPKGAQDRLGRRRARQLRLGGLPGRAGGGGQEARRQGRAQRGRRLCGAGQRREEARGRLLRPALRARDDGMPRGDRAHRQRRVRGLGAQPVAAGSARPGRQAV